MAMRSVPASGVAVGSLPGNAYFRCVRILVTGGAGYVGSFCARHLIACGHEVCVLDDLSRGHRDAAPTGALVVGSLDDRDLLGRLFAERRIEAVLHFAASSLVGESVLNPAAYYRNNVANSLALLEAMVEHDVGRIVFSSTCAIYGEAAEMPLHERLPDRPENPYAFSKLVIERMIRDFSNAHGLGFVLLRYFNAAGASPDGTHGEDHSPETHLIPLVLQALLGQRDQIEIYGDDYPTQDGTCIRDYVHVEDLAHAHALALEICPAGGPGGHLFNLGTGTGSSVREVITSAERVAGRKLRTSVVDRRPGDVARLVASADHIRATLGWEPRFAELDTIVAHAWAWHRAHPDGYTR